MTMNLQFNRTTNESTVFGRGDSNGDVPPITPCKTRKVVSGNQEPPLTPTMQSTSTEDTTVTSGGPVIDGSVSSNDFLPPTPEPTPKTTSTSTPNSTHSTPISPAPLLSSQIPTPTPTSPASLPPRDRYDLYYTRSVRPHRFRQLIDQSERIRTHYQTLEFYRKWTSHFISQLSGIPIIRNTTTSPSIFDTTTTTKSIVDPTLTNIESPRRADYVNELAILIRRESLLKQWEIDAAKAEMEALASLLLTRPLSSSSFPKPDILLYRVHTSVHPLKSKSPYSRDMGIRCSGWQDSLIDDQPSEKQIYGRAFQAHCERTVEPSPYISVHTSIARLIRFITSFNLHHYPNDEDCTVFVISLNKLKQLGIKATCTDDILASFREKSWTNWKGLPFPSRIRYVTNSHWLVDGWIPDQTIVSEMAVRRFLEIAKDGGIDSEVIEGMGELDNHSPLVKKKIGLEKWPVRWVEGRNEERGEKSLRSGSETASGLGSGVGNFETGMGIEAQGAGSSISKSKASSEDIENALSRLEL
ncbi:hypothetical protein OCU04_002315 [Sclerotinia nivalis]|uniref:DUF7587 domain-containing protein n=1 Tax=Sclerotinia nivalis TaxID=352851 RepID=A0A9X0AWT3_9HELO|nr:hypothetical protein OCU04_002315 [Sclerotinia nivalis]